MARALLLGLLVAGPVGAGCSSTGAGPASGAQPAADSGGKVAPPASPAPSGVAVTLERLIDGDSMELAIDDGGVWAGGGEGGMVEVRLLGVNAPELRTLGGAGSCNGAAARAALEDLLAGGGLSLVAGETDRFGRLLGVLSAGGQDLNQAVVADGWALGLWSADDRTLVPLMREAAAAGRGLWGGTCGPPVAGLEVGEVSVDAPGPDEEHLDQEWVEITNPTGRAVDLAGWTVADETTSNRFPLPATELGPGRSLRVVTGIGADDAGRFHLGQDTPVWNNGGETVLVVDPAGIVAAHRFVD